MQIDLGIKRFDIVDQVLVLVNVLQRGTLNAGNVFVTAALHVSGEPLDQFLNIMNAAHDDRRAVMDRGSSAHEELHRILPCRSATAAHDAHLACIGGNLSHPAKRLRLGPRTGGSCRTIKNRLAGLDVHAKVLVMANIVTPAAPASANTLVMRAKSPPSGLSLANMGILMILRR